MTTCTRCHGLMLEEHRIDMDGGDGEAWSFSWCCCSCGYQNEALLQQPLHQQVKPVVVSPHTVMAQEAFGVPWESGEIKPLAA
ncbi:MAG: hypothetical protein JSR31_07130 [Nitrospira sp.]|nr:hypothetical protein [Nitrospira sp.]